MVARLFFMEKEAAGSELTRRLDAAHLDVRASFWLYDSETNRWRLVLGIRQVDSWGPKRVYAKVQQIARGIQGLSISEVSAVSPQHPTIRLLRSAIQTGRQITSVQLSNVVVNDDVFEDAFIYRMM